MLNLKFENLPDTKFWPCRPWKRHRHWTKNKDEKLAELQQTIYDNYLTKESQTLWASVSPNVKDNFCEYLIKHLKLRREFDFLDRHRHGFLDSELIDGLWYDYMHR